jgi:hypothetical protein
MNTKKLITLLLGIFVLACIVALTLKEFSGASAVSKTAEVNGTKVVAYYFHGTKRCPTCTKIERYSRTAVDSFFTPALKNGKLEFMALNYDEPQYEHYWTDYKLTAQSLVLVRLTDGKQQKWENLTQIWELVGNEEQFYAYVKDGIDRFLSELP